MNSTSNPMSNETKRFMFGMLAILVSGLIAVMIKTGMASPYPDTKVAYFICGAMGVFGFVQLVIALISRKK